LHSHRLRRFTIILCLISAHLDPHTTYVSSSIKLVFFFFLFRRYTFLFLYYCYYYYVYYSFWSRVSRFSPLLHICILMVCSSRLVHRGTATNVCTSPIRQTPRGSHLYIIYTFFFFLFVKCATYPSNCCPKPVFVPRGYLYYLFVIHREYCLKKIRNSSERFVIHTYYR